MKESAIVFPPTPFSYVSPEVLIRADLLDAINEKTYFEQMEKKRGPSPLSHN